MPKKTEIKKGTLERLGIDPVLDKDFDQKPYGDDDSKGEQASD